MDTLTTERLVLRPLEVSDAPALWPYVSDPELPRFMSWDAHRAIGETEAWLASKVELRARGVDLVWAIVHDGAAAGTIGLDGVTRQFRAWRMDCAELGYWLAPPLHGRGLMTEAARAVMAYGFGPLGLHKITVSCIADNGASRRVIEKLGFRFVGVRRDHMHRFERWWDLRSYELCADEV